MPKTLQPISRNISFYEQQLQKIFTSPVNQATIPVENRFIKQVDFLPKTLTGDLNIDISYAISWHYIPLNQNLSLSDIIGQNFYYSG